MQQWVLSSSATGTLYPYRILVSLRPVNPPVSGFHPATGTGTGTECMILGYFIFLSRKKKKKKEEEEEGKEEERA